MKQLIEVDVCVIGAGTGGLSVAAGTSQLGLKTALIEANLMGGDCLNTGCVPSKAMLALAKAAHGRAAGAEGQPHQGEANVGQDIIHRYVHQTIETIAPHDSQERFEGLGVQVIREHARFVDENIVVAGDAQIRARYFVIATGSRASIPPIPGLDPERVLTNETIFDLREKPDHLIIIGGGPIGAELGQAHRRLGSSVTVIDMSQILPKDDPELVQVIRTTLQADGIDLIEKAEVERVEHTPDGVTVHLKQSGAPRQIAGSHLLVAAGRQPNVEDLGLEAAGIEYGRKGIKTGDRLRTNRRHIFALGDVAGGPQFTHVAGYQAGIVVRNIAFRIPAKVDYSALPWVTYTDPELAHVGLTEQQAREKHGDRVRTIQIPFESNDRAIAERRTEGLIKVIARPNGQLLGVSIVGPSAGEMIGMWCLAVSRKLSLRNLTGLMLPYPTLGEVGKKAASEWYRPTVFGDKARMLVGFLQKVPIF